MLRILTAADVKSLLNGCERAVIGVIRDAYMQHHAGRTRVPHSSFLYMDSLRKSRIIALPASVGGDAPVAGIKWISSFPDNIARGLDRASAVIILNSTVTGYPELLLEGSLISSWRTAASAALATEVLHGSMIRRVGIIGCGLIALTYCRFMAALFPSLAEVRFADLSSERAAALARRVADETGGRVSCRPSSTNDICANCPVVLFATTASEAHICDPAALSGHSTVLHISLRDLSPEVILAADNIVDDVEHVTREQTSIHVAAEITGGCAFIRCTLGEVLAGTEFARSTGGRPVIFSPFGLGILDLAVARFVRERAEERGVGTQVLDFVPVPWDRS